MGSAPGWSATVFGAAGYGHRDGRENIALAKAIPYPTGLPSDSSLPTFVERIPSN